MNIALMFESWGLKEDVPIVINIAAHHKNHKTSLQMFNRILCKAYHPKEIPNILKEYSPPLGSSILDYLCDVEDGAGHLVDMIEHYT